MQDIAMKKATAAFDRGRIPFLRLTIALMLGIRTAHWYGNPGSLHVIFPLLLLLFTSYTLLFLRMQWYKGIYQWQTLLGLLGLATLVLIGHVRVLQQNPTNSKSHFIHHLHHMDAYEGIVLGTPNKVGYKQHLLFSVERITCNGQWLAASGKCKLVMPARQKVVDGVHLHIRGSPIWMTSPTNPHVVDYNNRWRLQGAFHEHILHNEAIKKIRPPNWWRSYRHRILVNSSAKITSAIDNPEVAGVVLALMLGVRNNLQGISKVYKKVGVMHVLAVSGLHIGLLYGLLLLLFALLSGLCGGWLGRPQHHRWVALLLLWAYAALIGFPPSVVRAVGMLSLIILAQTLLRPYDTMNGLCFLAFVSLLYNPYWLFDIGFQLSFVAVASILLFYPPIVKAYTPNHPYLQYWWQGTALSIAAQLGTSPLSIHYFHRFPSYFLLGNTIMLPLVSCLLVLALGLLACAWLGWQSAWLSQPLVFLIQQSTTYLRWIGQLPGAYLGPFHWSPWVVICCYLILGFFYLGIRRRHFIYLAIATTILGIASLASVHSQLARANQKHLVVYDVAPHQVIGFIEGRKAILLGDQTMNMGTSYYRYQIQPSLTQWKIKTITQKHLLEPGITTIPYQEVAGLRIYRWGDKRIAITTNKHAKHPTYKRAGISVDILCIMDDAIDDMETWLGGMQVGTIILGKTNRHRTRLMQQAKELNIPLKEGGHLCACRR